MSGDDIEREKSYGNDMLLFQDRRGYHLENSGREYGYHL